MADSLLNKELVRYWAMLTSTQKQALFDLIKSFIQDDEDTEQYNLELHETEAGYRSPDGLYEKMLMQLKEWEKKSVLLLIKSFLRNEERGKKRINIEQYNKEIDAAMKRIDAGEFISHEDLEKEAEQW